MAVGFDATWLAQHHAKVKKVAGAPSTPSRSKYRAQPKVVDNVRFASTKEADRYEALRLLAHVGAIRNLELQPRFDLITHMGDVVGSYVADFRYYSLEHQAVIIEDVKSPATATPLYKLKKKIAESCHAITISEV